MPIGQIYQSPLVPLNFNTDWEGMPDNVKNAFLGKPKRVRLERGFELYKFSEYDMISSRNGRSAHIYNTEKITEWWSPVVPYGLDAGLESRLKLARILGTSPADLIGVIAAVREDWNSLDHLIKAQLRQDVYCFWGQCATQPRISPKSKAYDPILHRFPPLTRRDMPTVRTRNLPGYSWQFYIPKLTRAHIVQISRTHWRDLII